MKDDTVIDEELATLPAACDGEVARARLGPAIAAHLGAQARIEAVRAQVVRQRLKRCVVLYHVDASTSGARRTLQLYGKIFRPGEGRPIFEKMRALWDQGFSRESTDAICMPEPLDFVADLELLVLSAVPGRSFKERLLAGGSEHTMRRVAAVLVKLHRLSEWPGSPFRLDRHVARCHPKHPRLAEALPDVADDVETILRESARREAALHDADMSAIHGDLHLSQILMDDQTAHLIDLDGLARGDPASDLANFLVFLRSNRRVPDLAHLEKVFLEAYFAEMDAAIALRIPIYEAVTHVRRACKDLRFGRPGWEERARSRIALGIACLDAG